MKLYFYMAFDQSGAWRKSGEVRATDEAHALGILSGLYLGLRFELTAKS